MSGIVGGFIPLQAGDWAFVLENWEYLQGGLVLTIELTVLSILLGFLAGFPAGAIEVYGGRWSSTAVEVFGVLFRGTPLVVILFLFFFGLRIQPAFIAGLLGLGLRSAAYQSQIFRGTLQSVSEGQMEAARSIGLDRLQAIYYVIVPQALRRSIPGFQNEFTIVLKDTSLVYAIGLLEFFTRADSLFTQRTTAVLEVILFISAIYFILTFGTNRALDYLQEAFTIPGSE